MWIRSQHNDCLVDAKRIMLDGNNIINYVAPIPDGEDFDTLGSYSSRERALEVLDDMQARLNYMREQNTYVFQMPKE